MNLSILQLLYALLVVQAIVVASVTFKRRKLWPLTAFLATLVVHMALNFFTEALPPGLANLSVCLSFLYGPLMYLLVNNLALEKSATGMQLWPHFLPSAAALGLALAKIEASNTLVFLALGGVFIYLLLSLSRVNHYQQVFAATHSSQDFDLSWLRKLLWILAGAMVVEFARYGLLQLGFHHLSLLSFYLTLAMLLWFILSLTYMGIRHSALFVGISPSDEGIFAQVADEEHSPTGRTEIDPKEVAKLEDYLATARVYLNPDLTVAELAEQIAMPAKDLSALINQHFQVNFCEFINRHRVRSLCEQMMTEAGRRQTLIELMAEAGFNSKSSFNQAFKKATGKTPSAFRNALMQGEKVQIPEFGRQK